MKTIIIFDLDGTLANIEHRKHFITGDKKDWDSFYKACVDDSPNEAVCEIFRMLSSLNVTILILSGRSDIVEKETIEWLVKNGVYNTGLRMRPHGDFTPDEQLKELWLKEIRAHGMEPLFVFDDRKKVVDMWRRNGVACFQVADGDF